MHHLEARLDPFLHAEATEVLSLFEQQLGEKLRSDLHRQIIENSRGYPWLLKKLCIHIFEQIRNGASQYDLVHKTLDVKSLFDRDLTGLTTAEYTCLKEIALNAPADWIDILQTFDQEILRALQDKRLIIRSGDKLNIYWDTFREYVLTGTVPSLPITYLPTSPSVGAVLKVAQNLSLLEGMAIAQLSNLSALRENTVANVIRDLTRFGVATVTESKVQLSSNMENSNPRTILEQLRRAFRYHALNIELSKIEEDTPVSTDTLVELLKMTNPAAQYRERTWTTYAVKMSLFLGAVGYLALSSKGKEWIRKDIGDVPAQIPARLPALQLERREDLVFLGETSPAKAVEEFEWLRVNQRQKWEQILESGYRNAIYVLRYFKLVEYQNGEYFISEIEKPLLVAESIWVAAQKQPVLQEIVTYLLNKPTARGKLLGQFINQKYNRGWAPATEVRIGNGLRQWALWTINGQARGTVPPPPGKKARRQANEIGQQTFLSTDNQ